MELEMKDSADTGVTTVCVRGDMTIFHAMQLKDKTLAALHASDTVCFDLASVQEIDSAGFQILCLLVREAQNSGKTVEITHISTPVQAVIDLYCAENLLQLQ